MPKSDSAPKRPRSPFLRELSRALTVDVRGEVELAMQVGTLVSLGYSRSEIACTLDVSPPEVQAAVKRLKRVAPQLETGYLPPEFTEE